MFNYSAPTLVEYGDSKDLIKGTCGWGGENAWFDKTDYRNFTYLKCTQTVTGDVFNKERCESITECLHKNSNVYNKCSSDSDCR